MFITLATDFGKQSYGVGMMEAVIAEVAPEVRVIHYMHGAEDYDTTSVARVLETVWFIMPAIHVCVCDPGVEVREISNPAIMRHPVSTVFHGRDVFCPAAAHLANGLSFELLGEAVDTATLAPASFTDAKQVDGGWMARVIHVDKFGNAQLNISQDEWRALAPANGCVVDVVIPGGRRMAVEHRPTFGDVRPGAPVILSDNDGRPALAVNRGNFATTYEVHLGGDVVVEYAAPLRRACNP
jgi:S-adenosyl-L-methionine hydrolase (adenosine-forming)